MACTGPSTITVRSGPGGSRTIATPPYLLTLISFDSTGVGNLALPSPTLCRFMCRDLGGEDILRPSISKPFERLTG
jgi:hypothetical protein